MKTLSVKLNNYYPLKHWLSTLIIAPAVFSGYDLIMEKSTFIADLYGYVFLFSLLFSIPGFLAYNGLFFWIAKYKRPVYLTKVVLNLCAICIGLATLLIIERSLIDLIGIYAIAVIISSFFFKIYKPEEPLPIKEDEHTQS